LYLNPDLCRFLYCMINVSSISLTNVLSILDTFNTGVTRTLSDTDHVEEALSFLKKQQVDPMVHYPLTLASMLYVTHYFY